MGGVAGLCSTFQHLWKVHCDDGFPLSPRTLKGLFRNHKQFSLREALTLRNQKSNVNHRRRVGGVCLGMHPNTDLSWKTREREVAEDSSTINESNTSDVRSGLCLRNLEQSLYYGSIHIISFVTSEKPMLERATQY